MKPIGSRIDPIKSYRARSAHLLAIFLVFSSVPFAAKATMLQCSAVFSSTATAQNRDDLQRRTAFIAEALRLELVPEIKREAYRFDNRDPKTIRAVGFSANPKKSPGSILEHVKPGSQGTSSYVSFTLMPENTGLLNDNFIEPARYLRDFPNEESRINERRFFEPENLEALQRERQELLAKLTSLTGRAVTSSFEIPHSAPGTQVGDLLARLEMVSRHIFHFKKGPAEPLTLVYYEYKAKDVFGVTIDSSIGLEKEVEFLALGARPNQVLAFRKVYIIMPGEGAFMLSQKPQSFSRQLQFRLLESAKHRVSFIFEDWQSLR